MQKVFGADQDEAHTNVLRTFQLLDLLKSQFRRIFR
jgi:hypothetical protein